VAKKSYFPYLRCSNDENRRLLKAHLSFIFQVAHLVMHVLDAVLKRRVSAAFLTCKMDFFKFLELSTRERLRTGGSSLRALSTKPPLESSTLRSRSAAGSAAPPPAPESLRKEVIEALNCLVGR
jgi:hypothetical protein